MKKVHNQPHQMRNRKKHILERHESEPREFQQAIDMTRKKIIEAFGDGQKVRATLRLAQRT